ncbi:MAG: hypothetical protein HDQ87_03915 [Clostridia bacterium]|nr:hypothetical protein [Clostridia bacterium]
MSRSNPNRSMKGMLVVFSVLFVMLASYLFYSTVTYGEQWFSSPYNPRISASRKVADAGSIYDRNGMPLAWSEGSVRRYAEDPEIRRAVCHVVGDVYGKSMGAEAFYARYLYGYDQGLIDRFVTAFEGDRKGGDVYLTIDARLCGYILEHMDFQGAVVLMNYETGEILASVSNPTFDPEAIPDGEEEETGSQYLNRVTQGRYPPGSTMKIVTAACAIENGVTDAVYDCPGEIVIAGQRITCPRDGGHGEEDLAGAFEDSCNVYFAQLAVTLGADRMTQTADRFLFNHAWHLADFAMLESSYSAGSNNGDLAWSGVGQYRDLITPMHNLLISGAVARQGSMIEPQTLLDVRYGGRSGYTYTPHTLGDPVSSSVAGTLGALMRATVLEGTATSADIEEAAVSGKTGTAEYTDNGETRNHSWFVGFSQDPAHPLAIAVILEGAGYGSRYATPLAGRVLSRAIELGY